MKKKKSRVLPVLVTILVILVLLSAALAGNLWYRNTHIFIEKKAYSIHAESLDLTGEDISFDHYDALHAALPDCDVLWNVPFQGGKYPSNTVQLNLQSLTEADIALLRTYFPDLKQVTAAGGVSYDLLEILQYTMPELEVQYRVNLGGKSFAPDVTELELGVNDYTPEALMENLPHLPDVKSILLHTPDLSAEQIAALREAFPETTVRCTVEILGSEYDAEVSELDLSAMTSDQVEEVAGKLAMLPELEKVELMDAEGKSGLTKEDARTLIQAAPNAVFHYSFDFYGKTLSTDTEEVHLNYVRIGDAGEADVRLALDLMPSCKRFVLENCGLSNDVLAQIRDDYRDRTKVVWRVYFGHGSALTDVDVIRCVYDLVDDNSHDLVYCEDVRFLDIGHDEFLDGIAFIRGMTKLEYVIVSGSPIKDLSPFSTCTNLKVLEAAFCEYLTDVSPLASCEKLEMLNISYTHIADLQPIDHLNVGTLFAIHEYGSRVPPEERERYAAEHPDCNFQYAGTAITVYGEGWRYNGTEKLDWYQTIANAFQYPDSPNNTGWYFEG